jgi:hypothetical protein
MSTCRARRAGSSGVLVRARAFGIFSPMRSRMRLDASAYFPRGIVTSTTLPRNRAGEPNRGRVAGDAQTGRSYEALRIETERIDTAGRVPR